MKLTYDSLLHVISTSLYAKDTLQLMATCRVLYREGPKIALKKPAVILTARQLASFLLFLHADNSSRCRCLRQLELKAFSLEANVVQELIETLPLLTNIQCLRLVEVEQVLELHPALTSAFCALTTLRHIDFSGVKSEGCALLVRLHSPLISTKINFLSDDDQQLWDYLDDDEWDRCHPTILLDNFASTLEELQCICWYTTHDKAIMPTQVYPNMRKLSVQLHYFPLRIDAFIRAFPNLTHLHLDTHYHHGDVGPFNLEAMHESHTTNVAQQRAPVNPCGTWAHLEHFHGRLVELYAIGLTSHIRRVTLADRLDDGPQTEMLEMMLRYARPLHLKIEAITSTFLGDTARGFIAMLRDAGASNIINLDVCIYFGRDDREKDLSIVLNNLVSALTCLPLKFLELKFVTGLLDPTPRKTTIVNRKRTQRQDVPEPPAPISAPLAPAELSLKRLDMDALVARLESMPSLQTAHILLPSSRCGGDYDWEGHERMITKGTSRLDGSEQWESWIPGKNGLVLSQSS